MSGPAFSRSENFTGIEVTEFHENLSQEVITITEDKLRLIVSDYVCSISRFGGWLTPASLIVSFVMTFCTATFEVFFGMSPDFWRAFFALLTVFSVIWLIRELWLMRISMTQDEFIELVKRKKSRQVSNSNST